MKGSFSCSCAAAVLSIGARLTTGAPPPDQAHRRDDRGGGDGQCGQPEDVSVSDGSILLSASIGAGRGSHVDGPTAPASAGRGESAHRPFPESGKRPAPDAAGAGRRSGVRGRVRGWRGRRACRWVRVRTRGHVRARRAARGDGRRRSDRGVGSSSPPALPALYGRSPGAASRTRLGTGNAATPPVPPITKLHVRPEAKPPPRALTSAFEGAGRQEGSRLLVRSPAPPGPGPSRQRRPRRLARAAASRIPVPSARLGGFCVTRDTQ